jgi:glycosyltransferase involved in cell wall biosynthesis
MKLAIVSGPFYAVPPHDYGGIERGTNELSTVLAERGHRLYVLASGESSISHPNIRLVPHVPRALCVDGRLIGEARERSLTAAEAVAVGAVRELVAEHGVEVVIQRWERPRLTRELARLGVPLVVSIGRGLSPAQAEELFLDGVAYTALTHAHKVSLGGSDRLRVVRYGIDMRRAPLEARPLSTTATRPSLPLLRGLQDAGLDYLLHIGAIDPRKSQKTSIEIAQKAGVPLIIAGRPNPFRPDAARYFMDVLRHAEDPSVIYFGSADEAQKWELMSLAKATLFCSGYEDGSFREPFGRVLAESTATGTPVIGYRYGSFPELIEEGVTGYGFDTVQEAVGCVARLEAIDRVACARRAREAMAVDPFVDDIEALARELIAWRPETRTASGGR